MTWMQTHSGTALDLSRPDPSDVRLHDVAHALAHLCRYNGHTSRHYSVAEHCCHVADYLEDRSAVVYRHLGLAGGGLGAELALAGLLHDASEAYVGDLTFPMQQALGADARIAVRGMHDRVWWAISAALHVPTFIDIHATAVKWVDRQILLDERNALMGEPPRPWDVPGEPLGVTIRGWSAATAKGQWLVRYARLSRLVRP